jgi:hypothetical protein
MSILFIVYEMSIYVYIYINYNNKYLYIYHPKIHSILNVVIYLYITFISFLLLAKFFIFLIKTLIKYWIYINGDSSDNGKSNKGNFGGNNSGPGGGPGGGGSTEPPIKRQKKDDNPDDTYQGMEESSFDPYTDPYRYPDSTDFSEEHLNNEETIEEQEIGWQEQETNWRSEDINSAAEKISGTEETKGQSSRGVKPIYAKLDPESEKIYKEKKEKTNEKRRENYNKHKSEREAKRQWVNTLEEMTQSKDKMKRENLENAIAAERKERESSWLGRQVQEDTKSIKNKLKKLEDINKKIEEGEKRERDNLDSYFNEYAKGNISNDENSADWRNEAPSSPSNSSDASYKPDYYGNSEIDTSQNKNKGKEG